MESTALKPRATSEGRKTWDAWPRYQAASKGFLNYWYPILWSRDVKTGKPQQLTVVGETIMVFREPTTGVVHAMRDRCPHRGVPLSFGSQEFPGTFSCPYHGWTFDLDTGILVAAITDGPDSPICGKVQANVFPVEERLGLVFVFIGDTEDIPPIEADLPEELVANEALTIGGRITVRNANWRYGTENGYDEGHAKWLHRFSWMNVARRAMSPVWSRVHIENSDDGIWATRVTDESYLETDFPGLGRWPSKRRWFQRRGRMSGAGAEADPAIVAINSPGIVSLRMPCTLRVIMSPQWVHYDWCVGIDDDNYRYVQIAVMFRGGAAGRRFKLKYLAFLSWVFHGQFTGQDDWMVRETTAPPERLYRPDVSIISWRRLCERARRGTGPVYETPVEIDGLLTDDVVPMHETAGVGA